MNVRNRSLDHTWQLQLTAFLCLSSALLLGGCNRASSNGGGKNANKNLAKSPAENSNSLTPVGSYQVQPFAMPKVENPGYVGYQQCAECHAARVAECEPTSHFQTCRAPTPERMPAAFMSADVAERTLQLPGSDVVFEMSERNGDYFQTAKRVGSPEVTESSIDLVYGAKSVSDEVYLSWHADDSLWELPVAWVYANNCWGAAGFDKTQGGDFARQLTVRCFECHTTWFEHVPGTTSTYRRDDLLLGVTCERCHGPGREHVEFHRLRPEEKKSHAIVFPGALERERLIDVCTQCHSNSVNHKGPALSFRPGEKLEDYYRTVHPKYSESDRVANQIVPLRESKCFQQSQMTCITCHDPHITDKGPHGMTAKETCTQCHQPAACKQLEEAPAQVADKCVECHMRKYAKINVNFAQADDWYVPPLQRVNHQIQVDPIATDEVMLQWYRTQSDAQAAERATQLELGLLDHWHAQGKLRATEGRFVAAVSAMREALRVNGEHAESKRMVREYAEQQRQFDDLRAEAHAMRGKDIQRAVELFQQVIAIRPDDAGAHGRLGTLYAQQGNREEAVKHLGQVAKLDPDDQYGLSMQGWLAYLDSDFKKAADFYQQADAIEPFSTKINFLWGSCLARLGKFEEAAERLRVSVKSDPQNLDALRELVLTLMELSDYEAAVEVAEQAARLTQHRIVRELMVLAQCHCELGNKSIATDIVQLAVLAAQNPTEVTKIRQWSQENDIDLP